MSTSEQAMTTESVATRFYEYAQQGKWFECQDELFSDDAVSIEPPHAQGLPTVEGKKAIREKGIKFQESIEEAHGGYTSKPIVAGNHFAVAMTTEVTIKGMGKMKMEEIALYEVKDGKIVKEQFFY